MTGELKIKQNGSWNIPKSVYVNQSGSWNSVQKIYRKESGNWVMHWPIQVPFSYSSSNYQETGWVSSSYNDYLDLGSGQGNLVTAIIPSSYRNSGIPHVTGVGFEYFSYVPPDGFSVNCGYSTNLENTGTVSGSLGSLNYIGPRGYYFDFYGSGTGEIVTFDRPTGHVIVGFQIQWFWYYSGTMYYKYEVTMITAPILVDGQSTWTTSLNGTFESKTTRDSSSGKVPYVSRTLTKIDKDDQILDTITFRYFRNYFAVEVEAVYDDGFIVPQ